jgi:hypothetical protein
MQHEQYDGHGLLQSRTLADSDARSGQRKVMLRFELCTKRHYLSAERHARYCTSNSPTFALSANTAINVECVVLSPN